MTGTVVDALQDATAELHNAAVVLDNARTVFQAQSAQNVQQTTKIVNDAVAIQRVWHCDPVNGDDNNDGSTLALAKKTLHSIIGLAAPSTGHLVYLFGDYVHTHYSQAFANLTIRGSAAVQPSSDSYAWMPAQRKITFQSAAAESPFVTGTGAQLKVTSLFHYHQPLQFMNCDIYLADIDAGYYRAAHFLSDNGAQLVIDTGNIYATTPGNAGRLVASISSAAAGFWFRGTIASAAQGRIFTNVAAGADPNASKVFNTNLTTN